MRLSQSISPSKPPKKREIKPVLTGMRLIKAVGSNSSSVNETYQDTNPMNENYDLAMKPPEGFLSQSE